MLAVESKHVHFFIQGVLNRVLISEFGVVDFSFMSFLFWLTYISPV